VLAVMLRGVGKSLPAYTEKSEDDNEGVCG
jgi:hypothetical protein